MFLWYYVIELHSLIHNGVLLFLLQAQGKTPHECNYGNQSKMSNICNFGLKELVHYRDFGSFPENKENLGRMFGPLKNQSN